MSTQHEPVLFDEVLSFLAIPADLDTALYFDGTLGGGGHARGMLEAYRNCLLFGTDQDERAIERAQTILAAFEGRVCVSQQSFAAAVSEFPATELLIREVFPNVATPVLFDRVLLDLGISSDQLNDAERGFAFSKDGPLDMRMNRSEGPSAAEILNSSSASDLTKIFRVGGVGPLSHSLAAAVIDARPLSTTKQFADVCRHVADRGRRKVSKGSRSTHHPATVPFQALRIAVNKELQVLSEFLSEIPKRLAPGGRLAIISFHSLEDESVAKRMRAWSRTDAQLRKLPETVDTKPFGKLLTPKAVIPSSDESSRNPRSRSARLRVFERSVDGGLLQ